MNGVDTAVNAFRHEQEFELRRFVENFFYISVAQVLQDLPNNQNVSVGQRFIVNGNVSANESYVRMTEVFGVVLYQVADNINARVEKIVFVLREGAQHMTHNPKVAATQIDNVANAVVSEQLEQRVDIRNNNLFVMRTATRTELFAGVCRLAPNVVGIYIGKNFAVTL